MVPFVEVLLHTWLDLQRDDQDRTINHHGKELDVGSTTVVRKVYNFQNYQFVCFYAVKEILY